MDRFYLPIQSFPLQISIKDQTDYSLLSDGIKSYFQVEKERKKQMIFQVEQKYQSEK